MHRTTAAVYLQAPLPLLICQHYITDRVYWAPLCVINSEVAPEARPIWESFTPAFRDAFIKILIFFYKSIFIYDPHAAFCVVILDERFFVFSVNTLQTCLLKLNSCCPAVSICCYVISLDCLFYKKQRGDTKGVLNFEDTLKSRTSAVCEKGFPVFLLSIHFLIPGEDVIT